jgi:hypothetical protein
VLLDPINVGLSYHFSSSSNYKKGLLLKEVAMMDKRYKHQYPTISQFLAMLPELTPVVPAL